MFRQAFRSPLSSALRTASASSRLPSARLVVPSYVRLLSQEMRAKLDGAVNDPQHPLVVFMKGTPDMPQCGFSRAVVQLLEINGVPPEKLQTYNVLEDQELRDAIKEYSDWMTIPQVYVNGEFVGGCDILIGMHQSGELEALLAKNKIISPESPEASESTSSS